MVSLDFQIFLCKITTEFHGGCLSVGECIPSVKMLFSVRQSITANVELHSKSFDIQNNNQGLLILIVNFQSTNLILIFAFFNYK